MTANNMGWPLKIKSSQEFEVTKKDFPTFKKIGTQ